jgi:hypothetical protein
LINLSHNTGTTQWNDPREKLPERRSSVVELATTVNGDEEELPEGWERIDDETHGTFYVE